MFKNVRKEEITIPAQMSYLVQIREFIEHIGKKYKYSEKLVNSFKLVIDEACTNIIRHGYRDIKNGEIQVKAIIRRLSLTIIIIDQGISYDPRQANTPDLYKYVDIGKKGGLGILMMRKLMDDLQYTVTERGNEFRLTKYREAPEEKGFQHYWHSLNLRTKYSLVTSLVITIIAGFVFGLIFYNLDRDITDEALTTARTSAESLADNVIEDMLDDNILGLFEKARTAEANNDELIEEAFIVSPEGRILARSNPLQGYGRYELPQERSTLDSTQTTQILRYSKNDTMRVYDIVSEIRETIVGEGALLGYSHVIVSETKLNSIIAQRRLTLSIILLVILAVAYAGSFFLVARILKSFHSLADWVRQVVRGKVDQDEIDIDASDEIGEIAQAFNEMTEKFRKAQVNLMEQQKLQKELQVAQEIQQMLLPNDFPRVEGFDIGSYYEAAKEVGGDLFDFVEVDDDSVGIVVADVSGKGVPGSLIMTMIRTAIRLESRGNTDPADVLAKVNRFVTDDMKRGMFVTMFYVILDSRNRVIRYASAGHNPMILFRSSAKQTYYLNPSGFPVGIQLPDIRLFDQKIETDSIRLREDDILVLYTDGITEAMNHKRDLYREERFLAAIRENGHFDVAEFVKSIKNNLKDFTGGAPQNDDITFVAIKEKMMPGEIIYKTHKHLIELIDDGMRVKDACDKLNVSQYQYYKYKNIIDDGGLEALREYLEGQDYIEKRHLSIEMKAKVFDIIRKNPKHGAKMISNILNTEEYGNVEIEERRIYNELCKLRLNTFELRKRFVEKGQKKRLKQPGTPLLTLDGKVILDFESSESEINKRTGQQEAPDIKPQKPEAEEKKPIVKEMGPRSKDDDTGQIRHQAAKKFDPARAVREKEEKEEKTEEPKVAEAPAAESKAAEPKSSVKKTEEAPHKAKPETKQEEAAEKPSRQQTTRREMEEAAQEKRDQKEIKQILAERQDEFDQLEKLPAKIEENGSVKKELKNIRIFLKIILTHPIIKTLPELQQLFHLAQENANILYDSAEERDEKVLSRETLTLLNYLTKENILKADSIVKQINELGIQNRRLQGDGASRERTDLDAIRARIARKKIVKDNSLLQETEKNKNN